MAQAESVLLQRFIVQKDTEAFNKGQTTCAIAADLNVSQATVSRRVNMEVLTWLLDRIVL